MSERNLHLKAGHVHELRELRGHPAAPGIAR
jgi:hypothetical protein